jgi:hypothetical protein
MVQPDLPPLPPGCSGAMAETPGRCRFSNQGKMELFSSKVLAYPGMGALFWIAELDNKKILGRRVLFTIWIQPMINRKLLKIYSQEQKAPDGAYSLFVAQKV